MGFATEGPALQITTLEKSGGAVTKLELKALQKSVTLRGLTFERKGEGKYYEYEKIIIFYGKDYADLGEYKVKSAFGVFGKGAESPDQVVITFKDSIKLPVKEPRIFEIKGVASKGNEISQTDTLEFVETWSNAQKIFVDEIPDIDTEVIQDSEHRIEIKTISEDTFMMTSKNKKSFIDNIILKDSLERKAVSLEYQWNGLDIKTPFYTSVSSDLINIPITRITLLPEKSITMKIVPYSGLQGVTFSFAVSNAQKGYVDGVYNFLMDRTHLGDNELSVNMPEINKFIPPKEPKQPEPDRSVFDKVSQELHEAEQAKKLKRHLLLTQKKTKEAVLVEPVVELEEMPAVNLELEKGEAVVEKEVPERQTIVMKQPVPPVELEVESEAIIALEKDEVVSFLEEKELLPEEANREFLKPISENQKSLWDAFWDSVKYFFY